jgi:hypothetical protein
MTARKVYPERVCLEEGCLQPFVSKHHQQKRCSEACRLKAARNKNARHMVKVKEAKKNGFYSPILQVKDGADRGNVFAWKAFMRENPVYFKGLFPQSTVEEAAMLMRAWGLGCR